jgi:hypothetical protein
MLKLEGKIVTMTAASVNNDNQGHIIIEVLGQKPLSKVFQYLEVPNPEHWSLEERVSIQIESSYDILLREQEKEKEAAEMRKEIEDIGRENAKFQFPGGKEDSKEPS